MTRQPKIGDKIYISTIPEFKRGNIGDKYCVVTGLLLDTVFCRPNRSRNKEIDVNIEDIEFAESEIIKEEKLTREDRFALVRKLVMEETFKEKDGFIEESKLLARLIKKYPAIKFWREFEPGFQVKSLIWWIGPNGKDQMRVFYNEIMLDLSCNQTKMEVKLEKEKIGEDVIVGKRKVRNIIDLID